MGDVLQQFDENEMIFGIQLDKNTSKGTNKIVYVQKNKLNREGLVPLSDLTEDRPVTKQDDTDLEDSLVPLQVFTVDAEKYKNACKNGGVKPILEVANDNMFKVAMPQDKFSELPSIQMGKQSLTLKFTTNSDGKKFVNGIKQINDIGGQSDNSGSIEIHQEQSQVSETVRESEDVNKKKNLEEFSTLLGEESANNENVNEQNKKDKITSSFENMELNNQIALLKKLNKPETKDQVQLKGKKNAIFDLLAADEIDQAKINEEVKQLGGKATRRRKRRGKKRSKNTRKKRKSKKARKSKR